MPEEAMETICVLLPAPPASLSNVARCISLAAIEILLGGDKYSTQSQAIWNVFNNHVINGEQRKKNQPLLPIYKFKAEICVRFENDPWGLKMWLDH